jgi:hypothetical protein
MYGQTKCLAPLLTNQEGSLNDAAPPAFEKKSSFPFLICSAAGSGKEADVCSLCCTRKNNSSTRRERKQCDPFDFIEQIEQGDRKSSAQNSDKRRLTEEQIAEGSASRRNAYMKQHANLFTIQNEG